MVIQTENDANHGLRLSVSFSTYKLAECETTTNKESNCNGFNIMCMEVALRLGAHNCFIID